MSGFKPYAEDDDDASDPGPAFEHGPGMMGPPMRPGDFDAEASRGLTPPTPGHSPHQPPGLDEPPHATEPFSDDLYDEFARDRAGPPSPMSPALDARSSYAARSPYGPGGIEEPESSAAGLRSENSGEPFGLGQVREGSALHRTFVRDGFGGVYAPVGSGPAVAPGELAVEGEEEEEEEGRRERSGSAGFGSGWSGH